MTIYSFVCPKCGIDIDAEVDLGEHLVDHEEYCEVCGYIFDEEDRDKIYTHALEDSVGTAIDRAQDYGQER